MADLILHSASRGQPAVVAQLVGSFFGFQVEDGDYMLRERSIVRRRTPPTNRLPKSDAGEVANIAQPSVQDEKPPKQFKTEIIWLHVLICTAIHIAALYGFSLCFSAKWQTLLWTFLVSVFSAFGGTGGGHRLWAHRSFKAKWPLRIILATAFTVATLGDIYNTCRIHRAHHKFSETDADPHNAKRGMFFAHMGWLLCKPHPEVDRKANTIDLSDALRDPITKFQTKFYIPLVLMLSFAIPALVPWYYWGESLKTAFFFASMFRVVMVLHIAFLVNSVAHTWGSRPYDKQISPSEVPLVSFLTSGEGWHNYHHVFPWDYKAAELGNYNMNMTTAFIDFFAWLGWAYDLKTVPERIVRSRVQRTGDGTHPFSLEDSHYTAGDMEEENQFCDICPDEENDVKEE